MARPTKLSVDYFPHFVGQGKTIHSYLANKIFDDDEMSDILNEIAKYQG